MADFKRKGFNDISTDELKEAAKPLIELLKAKGHPLMSVFITTTSVELFEGVAGSYNTQEE